MSRKILKYLLIFISLCIVVLPAGCNSGDDWSITSPAFANNTTIPTEYSCDGQNVSPALNWSGAPAGTKSFALILHDPDAPSAGGFTHWVIFNIPPSSTGLSGAMDKQSSLTDGSIQGNNGAGNPEYTGPCPPAGPAHHYEFRLYALDQMLNMSSGATKDQLESAMSGHILGQALLTGLFQRS